MSAFVCSKNHIAAVAAFGSSKHAFLGGGYASFDSIYKTLADANVRSVCHRYGESADEYDSLLPPPDSRRAPKCSAIEIVKLCDCLDYQSSETDDWRESEACKLLGRIRNAAINALPGYDEAKWAIG